MLELSIREAREKLTDIETLVAAEGEIVITRHGKPVARVVPVRRGRKLLPSRAALRKTMPLAKTASERLLRDERDER